jgi:uncharacterized protein
MPLKYRLVMPRLGLGIHEFVSAAFKKVVDGKAKPCHDDRDWSWKPATQAAMLFLALFMGFFVLTPAFADPPIPRLTGRVVDDAHILDQNTISQLTSTLAGYEQSTTNQVVVVTLPDLQGYPIEDWGIALGRGWGIGQKGKDNGVLLIVAPKEHKVRIEVGYGLEGDLPDATANEIIQNEVIPQFKSGDLPGGISAGVNGILAALGGAYKPQQQPLFGDNSRFNVLFNRVAPFLFLALFVFGVVASRLRRKWDPKRRRRVWAWQRGGYAATAAGVFMSGGGSRGGGGGFSGGGGSFGGGGASGSW